MIIKLYKDNTSEKDLKRICDILRDGGVVIYPTDSVYAIGCAIGSAKGVEKLQKLSGKDANELSLIFDTISMVAEYCKVENSIFKLLKRNTPGAITFIMKSLSRIPDRVIAKRKTIGVRIPSNDIARAIVEMLGEPMLTTSLKSDAEGLDEEYLTDPELIDEKWGSRVDCVIDGGFGSITPTAVVDLSEGEIDIIRQGDSKIE
ncbi:MAG: L-threonylcarbamoyladenylate synthase [Rikenellaceae bacterium]